MEIEGRAGSSRGGDPDPEATGAYIPGDSLDAGNPGHSTPGPGRDLSFLDPPRVEGELGWMAHYRVIRPIGEGGMGLVFQAEDTHLLRPVALKVIRPELADAPGAKERFLREARAAAAIKHDHIVTIYQVGQQREVAFLAMEFLRGISLQNWLERGKTPSIDLVLRIGREVAAGLAAAHRVGLIHRDIKPGNIWLEAPNGRAKILDFGHARALKDDIEISRAGAIMGTPAFMSPEQARGEPAGASSDLFSLGCLLYRLRTGRLPFPGRTIIAVLTSLAVDTPPSPRELDPEVNPEFDALVMRLLAKNPDDRPASAPQVVESIRSIERQLVAERQAAELSMVALQRDEEDAPTGRPVRVAEVPRGRGVRVGRFAPWIAVALVLGLVVGGTAWLVTGGASPPMGILEIAADGPTKAVVVVERDGRRIAAIVPSVERATRLGAGRYRLSVEGAPDARLDTDSVQLARGGHVIIGLRPTPPAPATVTGPRGPIADPPKALVPVAKLPTPNVPPPARVEMPPVPPVLARPKAAAIPADLTPLVGDWGPAIDPDGDCKAAVGPEPGTAAIEIPGTPHLLSADLGRINAPRILRDVRGDFEARVQVAGTDRPTGRTTLPPFNPYHGGGLLIWQDPENYVRLEVAAEIRMGKPYRYVNYEYFKDGRHFFGDDVAVGDQTKYVRLERLGAMVRAAHSDDGVQWTPLSNLKTALPDRLQVGLTAISTSPRPLKAAFRNFRLISIPIATPEAGRGISRP